MQSVLKTNAYCIGNFIGNVAAYGYKVAACDSAA